MFEVVAAICLVVFVLLVAGFVVAVWLAIALWNVLANREPAVRETVIYEGSDDEW